MLYINFAFNLNSWGLGYLSVFTARRQLLGFTMGFGFVGFGVTALLLGSVRTGGSRCWVIVGLQS